MRLIFLGTGPAEAIPRPGHRDPACRDARRGGKSRRTRSAALVSAFGKNILIDAGPDIVAQLDRERVKAIDAVLLTHGHADAAGGFSALDAWAERAGLPSIPLYTDRLTADGLRRHFPSLERIRVARFLREIRIGRIRIKPFSVKHGTDPRFPTHGFLFGRSLAYASDVSRLPPVARRLLRRIPIFVLDAAMYFGRRMPSHLTIEQAIAIGEELHVGRLVLTQIGHSYPPHDIAQKEINRRARHVTLAYDGMRLLV